jgi:uncharacterized protein (UPF0262 family)
MSQRQPKLIAVALDERSVVRRNPDVEHERRVAIFDLIEENRFDPAIAHPGPYKLLLSLDESRLVLDIRSAEDGELARVPLSLMPLRSTIRDYFTVCESYFEAIKTASPARIEAIDMGRRGLHNEGSVKLREALAGKVEVDHDTARRLFTLLCVLQAR